MALLIYAHPYPNRSRANIVLFNAVKDLEGLEVRSLYEQYPDFGIDIEDEQAALSSSRLIIWQHPMYWYSVPALMKQWFDKVLVRGWAYGEGGTALEDKCCLWVSTTGGNEHAFSDAGMHAHPMSAFVPPVMQTARFCRMRWLEPITVHGAHRISDAELAEQASEYRTRVRSLISELEPLS